jgi:hypothetical protein
MFNSLSQKGIVNQNYTKILPHPSQNDNHQENKQQMLTRMCLWEEPAYTVGGNVNQCKHYGNQYGSSSEN